MFIVSALKYSFCLHFVHYIKIILVESELVTTALIHVYLIILEFLCSIYLNMDHIKPV